MAKVYEIKDGQKVEITTLDDIDLKNKQEEVELLIEDDLETKISLNQGERYIFGGDTQPGRWICVQGLKMWYSGIELDKQLASIEKSETNIKITDTEDSYITVPIDSFAESTYFHFVLSTVCVDDVYRDAPADFLNCSLSANNNMFYLTGLANSRLNGRSVQSVRFTNSEDFKQFGFLFNVTRISPPDDSREYGYQYGYINFNIIPIVINNQTYDLAEDISTSHLGKMLLWTGYAYNFTTPFANLYEYYYAIGLKTIYEKKTLEDVKQILSPTEGDS